MRLLVIGASKGIGLEAVKQGLARGYEVRAFARTANLIALSDPKLEKWKGSALNPRDVSAAMNGVDAVILTLGVPLAPGTVLGPVRIFSDATQIAVQAMKKAGVKRLICVTGFGAGDSRGSMSSIAGAIFRLILGQAYKDKDVQEGIVRDSGLEWVIARPVLLTNGPKTGRYQVLANPSEWRSGAISRADVADFLVKQAENSSYLGKTPVLTS